MRKINDKRIISSDRWLRNLWHFKERIPMMISPGNRERRGEQPSTPSTFSSFSSSPSPPRLSGLISEAMWMSLKKEDAPSMAAPLKGG